MAGNNLPVTLSGGLAEVETSRLGWLERTSEEERTAIREMLRKHDTTSIVGINALAADLFILVLCGDLSPSVALAAKPFLDFLTANTWQMMAESGNADRAPSAVAETIIQLKEKLTLRATYRQEPRSLPAPTVLEESEVELLEREEVG